MGRAMEFDGDIIITDPCYIIRAEHHGTTPLTDDDWEACGYGDNMEALGIHNYMTRDTIYGDWSCTVYNTDTNKPYIEQVERHMDMLPDVFKREFHKTLTFDRG